MSKTKKLIPCIFIRQGKAVNWFNDNEIVSEDVVALAKSYNDSGADEIIVFDLSNNDEEHDYSIDLMKRITRSIQIPMIAGGNIKRQEDVKKYLYAGAEMAIINLSKPSGAELIEEVSKRFGKDKIAVSVNDFDTLYKQRELIDAYVDEIIFMQRPDLDSVAEYSNISTVILTDTLEKRELYRILKYDRVNGFAGKLVSAPDVSITTLKEECESEGIVMRCLETKMDFKQFKLNSDGLIPVIVQHYKTNEVLMMAYMNEEAYENTLKTGKMTYYSRSRNSLWLKGETSGHYQLVKSLTSDCDNDTILAKVEQIGVACHTGAPTCFFTPLVEAKHKEMNPLQVFESVYDTIMDRKLHPKEGSYTNYLFDKGIDKILKKVGEEATELVIAAKNPNPEEIKYELSDFLYHAMVLMVERGVTWEDIVKELADR